VKYYARIGAAGAGTGTGCQGPKSKNLKRYTRQFRFFLGDSFVRDSMGVSDSGCVSSSDLVATSWGFPCGGSVGWVGGMPGGVNAPEAVSDSVGFSGTTLEVGWVIPPVRLLSGRYQEKN